MGVVPDPIPTWEARQSRPSDRTTSTKAKGRALRLLA